MNLQKILKSIVSPVISGYRKWYHQKTRTFEYNGVSVHVIPEVFSPIGEPTTKILLDYVNTEELTHKTVLELGCGSGIVSALAATKGALVTASDINEPALQELSVHSRDLGLNIITVYSDLFENLTFHFDYILINPPIPVNTAGNKTSGKVNEYRYFERLFSQLRLRGIRDTQVILVLSDEVEIFAISRRAQMYHLQLHTLKMVKSGWNRTCLYTVENEGE